MSWTVAALPVVLAGAWLLLPGLAVTYALGVRGVTAWGAAPAVSITSISTGAVAADLLGVSWGPLPAAAPAVAVAVAVTCGAGRRLWLRAGDHPGLDPRRIAWAATAGVAVAGALVLLTVRLGTGGPDALSQTYDAVFHYNAVAWIVSEANASSLGVGSLIAPSAATAFYPAAWHGLVSLVVIGSGASIPVATNAAVITVAAVAWPLGCLALVRQILGPSIAAAAITPVFAVGFVAFPWSLMTFGVLWPNLIGIAVVPAVLAAVVALCGLARTPGMSRPQSLALVLGCLPGLFLAHPNAVFSLAALSAAPAGWAVTRWARARTVRGDTRNRVVAAIGVLSASGVAAGTVVFLLTTPLLEGIRSFNWPAYQSSAQAAGEVLLNATNGKSPALAISFLVIVGIAAAVKAAHTSWLLPAHLVAGSLFVFASALEMPLTDALTGLWYNDSYRLAAMIPVTAVPLATIGLITFATWLSSKAPWAFRPTGAIVVLTGILLITSSGLHIRKHADFLRTGYPVAGGPLVSLHQADFFEEISSTIPDGAVVAANPWSGSSLLWALTGDEVLFPHMSGAWSEDQLLLAGGLRDAADNPEVCAAAHRLGVEYLMVGIVDFWPWDERRELYPGLEAPDVGSDFARIADDGQGNSLYRLRECAVDVDV